ncbi:type II secretion system protein GspG [Winogradskyella sp. SM1960]|uniref:type II secretion system protein GspG n=1 Tax=Winogradskyella sp. SM1960 TaxID=2865955 RepID=UPI001CD32326|nr:type II secretion system protein GspG [Winogradskyella sp. SM1960]
MFELILSTLAEFGLIREDFKHHKKITKKEEEDGVKRPFQRYFLQPSSILVISVLIIGCISAFIFFGYQRKSIFPKNTEKEISEMSDRMENWKENLGKYPTELNELIGNSPLRQDWKKDAWNREYKLTIVENGKGFLITSAGSDGKFGTEDDIKSE